MSKLEKIYLKLIELGVYAALFTPLITNKNHFFPYVSPKTFFFRIVVDVIAVIYVLLIVANRRYLPKANPLTIALAVFLLISVVTSLLGVGLERSLWSTYERMAGLLTLIHLFVFFLILASCFKERKFWERFMAVSVLIGIILFVYVYTAKEPTARGGGTLGNTSFLSAYLLFDIFFALILTLTKKGFWKIVYGLPLIPLVWLLLFPPQEPTRGAIGAFFGGLAILAVSSLLYFIYTSKRQLLKKLTPAFLVLAVFVLIGIARTDFVKKEIKSFQNSSSWEARAIVWKMGYVAWQEKPWLGWGQENFNIPFAKYFEPSLPLSGDIWYDRVHNIVFDNLVTAGIFGLLSYLAVFGVAVVWLFKAAWRVSGKMNVFLPLGLISILAAYFAQNIWVFDMISSYFMFFFVLAFVAFLIGKPGPESALPENKKGGLHPLLAGGLIIIFLLTLYFGNIQPIRASVNIIKGLTSSLEKSIIFFQKAVNSSPMALTEASEQFARVLSDAVAQGSVNRDVLQQGIEQDIVYLKKNIENNPQDFRTHLLLGKLYSDFFLVSNNPEHLQESERILEKAISLSPKNQQGYWGLAQAKLSGGDTKAAIESMEKAVTFEPKFGQAQWYLTLVYKAAGENKLALETARKAAEAGFDWTATLENLRRVIEIYQAVEDDQGLVTLYTLALQKDSKDHRFWLGLAVANANLRQFDKARAAVDEALKLKPDLAPQISEFLRSLPR